MKTSCWRDNIRSAVNRFACAPPPATCAVKGQHVCYMLRFLLLRRLPVLPPSCRWRIDLAAPVGIQASCDSTTGLWPRPSRCWLQS